ncbi:hypothetical protein V5F72_10680 [Xanthobacter flavus]|uniref:Dyp-type peroxidase n=1 Tax=Xanthobacter flavus TaxID=281 RepID=UPI00372C0368
MTQSLVTSAIPFAHTRADSVDARLDTFRPELFGKKGAIREALRGRHIHFMSITVVRGDVGEPTHLVFEMSGDGEPEAVIASVAVGLDGPILEIFDAAGIVPAGGLKDVLSKHRVRTGQGLFDTPGLDFCGTPGMTVERIEAEYALARDLRDFFDGSAVQGPPLHIFHEARAFVAGHSEHAALMTPEPLKRIADKDPERFSLKFIACLAVRGLLKFFWPVLVALGALVALATFCAWHAAGAAVGLLALVVSPMLAVGALIAVLAAVYAGLRSLEEANAPVDATLDPRVMDAISDGENLSKDTQQNHLAGISVMQPGRLRGFTLRIAFWVIGQLATYRFRPGFLGEISTIHYARWVLLPKTNKLLFFSNFGGSWESYLEDFITKAASGLTGIWSNTVGFPRTENLFFKGATDGDRFKRWARRQQQPSRFWYSAYPHLTTARIRVNAAIRQGLSTVSTEDEATSWLGLFGSKVRPDTLIETFEVQTLLYGGLSKHPYAECLALRLPQDGRAARGWLAQVEPRVSYGDEPPRDKVLILALSSHGLARLGLPQDIHEQFPAAFRAGMGSPGRANLLADTGDDHARKWLWGGPSNEIDAMLLVYAADPATLEAEVAARTTELTAAGGALAHTVTPTPLPTGPAQARENAGKSARQLVREPFGFADGISQPIVKGTRRWMRQSDAIHAVEPGEFLLGYPDGRGYFPPSPKVPAAMDPENLLPLADPAHRRGALIPNFGVSGANAERDLGRNGSFLVVRQLAQDVDAFNGFANDAAARYADHPAVPKLLDRELLPEWIGAKMVGRWKDGSSLVRFPHRPASHGGAPQRSPDNEFLFGAEDPVGERCPLGAHIRRSNPRDSLAPGSSQELGIVNRHRIFRVGRGFDAKGAHDPEEKKPGLLFMCLNADIERQFEFIQQSWAIAWQFHELENEVDPITGRGGKLGRLTIPSPNGPLHLTNMKDWVRMRGGAYLFMPSRSALRFLAYPPR